LAVTGGKTSRAISLARSRFAQQFPAV